MSTVSKYAAGFAVLVVTLVFTAWLPYRLAPADLALPPENSAEATSLSEGNVTTPSMEELVPERQRRVELFSQYKRDLDIVGSPSYGGAYTYTPIDVAELEKDELALLFEKRDSLWNAFVIDLVELSAASRTAYGEEFFALSNESSEYIRVYRYFCAWNGDWKNWFTVFIDIDNGEIYHFYVSSGMELGNPSAGKYYGMATEISTPLDIAPIWSEFSGFEYIGAEWDGNADRAAISKYADDHDVVNCNIWLMNYSARLFDLKVTMVS